MSRWTFLALLSAVALAPACATTHGPYDYNAEPDPRKGEFVLGPSDTLKITVWRNPELSTEAIVRPDGTISMPLVGDLPAAGRTSVQLKDEVVKRLRAYIKDEAAIVTVAVTAINSYRWVVSGNVERPGAYAANHYVTVTEAMALAGGPNKFSNPGGTVIIRSNDAGVTRRVPVDYNGVLDGTRANENLVVIAGDTIYVP